MKYDEQKHQFAVVSHGSALYGVGETKEAAISDAAEWIETKDTPQGECSVADVEELLNHGMGPRVCDHFYVISDADEIREYVENV